LAIKDRRKLKKTKESRESVRVQMGKDRWKLGVTGLATLGEPRGGENQNPALPEMISQPEGSGLSPKSARVDKIVDPS
jgi:hypothetical protein